jgi:hypothetical protein
MKEERGSAVTLEQGLARVFGLGLSAALLFLAIGIVLRPVLWLGIGVLMLVPLSGAVLVWRDQSVTTATRVNIGLAFSGVLVAVLIGLWLRR